jgi:hypothetical protein
MYKVYWRDTYDNLSNGEPIYWNDDINKDGKSEKIKIYSNTDVAGRNQTRVINTYYINIKGKQIQFGSDGGMVPTSTFPQGISLIDLDKNDKYKEIATCIGDSYESHVDIYRFCNNRIIKLGQIPVIQKFNINTTDFYINNNGIISGAKLKSPGEPESGYVRKFYKVSTKSGRLEELK